MHWTIQKLLEWEQIISLCKLFLLVFLSSDFFYVLFVICENIITFRESLSLIGCATNLHIFYAPGVFGKPSA